MMPTVSSISHDQGFEEGGQVLTITGTSLDGDVVVEVDGEPCAIQSASQTEVTCKTSKKVID